MPRKLGRTNGQNSRTANKAGKTISAKSKTARPWTVNGVTRAIEQEIADLGGFGSNAVPDVPYKKNWHKLTSKVDALSKRGFFGQLFS